MVSPRMPLPMASIRSNIASMRNCSGSTPPSSMINEEGGGDPEQFRMEAMFDRMDAIGKGILGLTIQCAQCHDHKFDPLTQADYYRMFAYLNNCDEANISAYSPDDQIRRQGVLDE